MFARISTFTVLALPLLAAATAVPRDDPPASQCNTGGLQCCNSIQSTTNSIVTTLAGLLGINLSGVTGLVGVTCSPISVIGIGGNSCTAQPVCCTNNTFHGVLALGCTPVNINL